MADGAKVRDDVATPFSPRVLRPMATGFVVGAAFCLAPRLGRVFGGLGAGVDLRGVADRGRREGGWGQRGADRVPRGR